MKITLSDGMPPSAHCVAMRKMYMEQVAALVAMQRTYRNSEGLWMSNPPIAVRIRLTDMYKRMINCRNSDAQPPNLARMSFGNHSRAKGASPVDDSPFGL